MAQFQPFDYGRAIGQGTTNALNTMQAQDYARNRANRNILSDTRTQQAVGNQEVEQTKRLAMATTQALRTPNIIPKLWPSLQKKGLIPQDMQIQGLSQEQIVSTLQNINDGAMQALQAYSGSQQQAGPSSVQEFKFFKNLNTDDKTTFMNIKRANPTVKTIDQGDRVVVVEPESGEVIAEFVKNLTPAQQPENIEATATAKIEGADIGKKAAGKTKRIIGASASKRKTAMLGSQFAKAKKQAGFWSTGIMGQALSAIGGTDAHNLRNTLNTIKANIGFDRLQEMRDNSVTGGALGQVSEQENKLLQSVWGALEQSQSSSQFVENLESVEKEVKASMVRIGKAYELDYGEPFPGLEGVEWERLKSGGAPQEAPALQSAEPTIEELLNKYGN